MGITRAWADDGPRPPSGRAGVLLVAFTARWAGGAPVVEGVELCEARWFSRHALRRLPAAELPSALSFASRLIDDFAGRPPAGR